MTDEAAIRAAVQRANPDAPPFVEPSTERKSVLAECARIAQEFGIPARRVVYDEAMPCVEYGLRLDGVDDVDLSPRERAAEQGRSGGWFRSGPFDPTAEAVAAWRGIAQNNPDPRRTLEAARMKVDPATGRRYHEAVALWADPARPPPGEKR